MKTVLPYLNRYRRALIFNLCLVVVRIGCVTAIPLLTRQLFYFDPAQINSFCGWLALLAFVITGMIVTSFKTMKGGTELGARIEADMRYDLFEHLQRLSFSFFDSTKTGQLMARFSNDLATLSQTLHQLPEDMISAILTLTVSFAVMFWLHSPLAAIALIPLPLAVAWGLRSKRAFKNHSREIREEVGRINSTVENSIQGMREVQSYTNEQHQLHIFDQTNRAFLNAKISMADRLARYSSMMIGFMRCHGVLITVAGAMMCVFGQLEMPDLLVFVMYARFMLMPIDRMINFSEQYAQGLVALERFREIYEQEPAIQNADPAVVLPSTQGALVVENITFAYTADAEPALKNATLKIEPGKTVAFVGESGAGKSTLINLIPRFYDVQQGRITLDGHDIRELELADLRRHIGVVQQHSFLFDSTIRENILFGRPAASEEELIQAAKDANIYDFIQQLPAGFDTPVGEHGVKLSGGQRQRISIARVFLKNPSILIFDEATSALDNESERLVQQAMEKLAAHRTTLIIAHRLSTVRNTDSIYALRGGRVVEAGSHTQLIAAQGYYHQLHQQGHL